MDSPDPSPARSPALIPFQLLMKERGYIRRRVDLAAKHLFEDGMNKKNANRSLDSFAALASGEMHDEDGAGIEAAASGPLVFRRPCRTAAPQVGAP